MMKQWQELLLKVLFWLSVEVIFNLIGIDSLADYSEFLLMPKYTAQIDRSTVLSTATRKLKAKSVEGRPQ